MGVCISNKPVGTFVQKTSAQICMCMCVPVFVPMCVCLHMFVLLYLCVRTYFLLGKKS